MSDFAPPDEQVDTGFGEFTAAVNPPAPVEPAPEPVGLMPDGLDALKAMIKLPVEFGPPQMVALARDIAINLYPLGTILANHKLTNAQYEFLRDHNEFFQHVVQQQAIEWQGIKSTQQRLKAEAAAALEEQLPSIANRMGQRTEKLADAVEAAKLFADIADVRGNNAAGRGTGGEGFTITIDLGADTRLTVGTPGSAGESPSPSATGALRPDAQGARDDITIPAVSVGTGGQQTPRALPAPGGGAGPLQPQPQGTVKN